MCNKTFLNHVSTVLLTPGIPQNSHKKHTENEIISPQYVGPPWGNL